MDRSNQTHIYSKEWKYKIGSPFRGMDRLFVYWLNNHFGQGICFDSRFIRKHVANVEALGKRYYPRFHFSLHPIVEWVDGEPTADIFPDLLISVTTGPRLGIRSWAIEFNWTAFDFDPIQAVQESLLRTKLSVPAEKLHMIR